MLFKPIQNFSTFNNRIPTEKLHNKNNLSITKYHSKKYINFPPHYLTNSTKMSFFLLTEKSRKLKNSAFSTGARRKTMKKRKISIMAKSLNFC